MKEYIYRPILDNKDSFIAFKFSIMPKSVIGNNSFKDSFPFIFMNNEFLKAVDIFINTGKIYDYISADDLINIRKLIKEGIDYYYCYDENANKYVSEYKNKEISIESIDSLKRKNNLYLAKYLCFKEAYDLKLNERKRQNYDIKKAEEIINEIDKIINVNYSKITAASIRKLIINQLKNDLKQKNISTTFELGYSLYNVNHFKALICSNEILKYVELLFNEGLLSNETIDFCVDIITISIYAKEKTLKKEKLFLLDKEDIDSFDKKNAADLKNRLICQKYKRLTIT